MSMYGQGYKCVPRWFGWDSIHCEMKMDKQVYTLEKIDDKIPIDSRAKRRQNQNMIRE